MDLADETVDACTHVPFGLENGREKAEVHELMWSLEVLAVVPLHHRIFQFTHPISITEDLKNSISNFPCFSVIGISENGIRSWHCQLWREPLNGVYVYHTLHIKEIYSNLDSITLTYWIYRLNIWPINQLRNVQIVELKRVFKLLELLKLLLFIFVHPHNSGRAFRLDIHFIISAIFRHASSHDLIGLGTALLAIGPRIHEVRPFRKFVLETGHQTFV